MVEEINTAFELVRACFMSFIILLDNMNVRFGNPVFCLIAGIPMRTNYTTLSFGSICPYL